MGWRKRQATMRAAAPSISTASAPWRARSLSASSLWARKRSPVATTPAGREGPRPGRPSPPGRGGRGPRGRRPPQRRSPRLAAEGGEVHVPLDRLLRQEEVQGAEGRVQGPRHPQEEALRGAEAGEDVGHGQGGRHLAHARFRHQDPLAPVEGEGGLQGLPRPQSLPEGGGLLGLGGEEGGHLASRGTVAWTLSPAFSTFSAQALAPGRSWSR